MGKKEKKYLIYLIIFFLLTSLFYFHPYLLDGKVIHGDDYNYTQNTEKEFFSLNSFRSYWRELVLGSGASYGIKTPTEIFLGIFPIKFATNFLFLFFFILMAWSSYVFFRSHAFRRVPSAIAGIFISFSPIYHTYIRTGHIDKLVLIPMMMFAFAYVTYLFKKQKFSLHYTFLIAFFLAMGFSDGDPQVFIYFSPFFVGYVILLMLTYHQKKDKEHSTEKLMDNLIINFKSNLKKIPLLILAVLLALLMSLQPLKDNFNQLIGESDNIEKNMIPINDESLNNDKEVLSNEKQKEINDWEWFWATQWSLPKLETLDLFIPGLFGFFTGSPTEPYWGRVGQTEGWERHHQGYQNYALAVNYLGVFFICFFIYGLFYAPKEMKWFWGLSTLFCLLLSYGKFFPLYQWFYSLPYMKEFRNPNRFLQLVHLFAGIIFGFGLCHFYERIKERLDNRKTAKPITFFLQMWKIVFGIGIFLLIILYIQKNDLLNYFGAFLKAKVAYLIVSNIYFYIFKAIIIFTIACLSLHYLIKKINYKNAPIWIAALLFFGYLDTYWINNKFYVFEEIENKNYSKGYIFDFIKNQKEKYPNDPFRVFFFNHGNQQEGPYLRYLRTSRNFPVSIFGMSVVRKEISQDFKNFSQTIINNDLRQIKLVNVRYGLSSRAITHLSLSPIYIKNDSNINEKIFIYEIKDTYKRFELKGNIKIGNNLRGILGGMNDSSFTIEDSVMLYEKAKTLLSDNQLSSLKHHPENIVKVSQYGNRKIDLKLDLKTPTILLFNSRYNSEWRAYNGDKLLPHFPVNYFLNGYYVTPEDKEITLRYKVASKDFLESFSFLINYLLFIVVVYLMFRKSRKQN